MFKDVTDVQQKEMMQAKIVKLYEDLVDQAKAELCQQCLWFNALGKGCQHDLLPITIRGDFCPYFRQEVKID